MDDAALCLALAMRLEPDPQFRSPEMTVSIGGLWEEYRDNKVQPRWFTAFGDCLAQVEYSLFKEFPYTSIVISQQRDIVSCVVRLQKGMIGYSSHECLYKSKAEAIAKALEVYV